MIKLKADLFTLARQALRKKGIKFTDLDVFDKAVEMRKELDRKEELKEKKYQHNYYLKRRK